MRVAARSDVGSWRSVNEDYVVVDPALGLVVCDPNEPSDGATLVIETVYADTAARRGGRVVDAEARVSFARR